jgi:hypothetical protein
VSAALAAPAAGQAQFGVGAAFPMERKCDLSFRAIDVNQDFLNKRACDPLFQPRAGGRIGPDRFELAGELVQVLARISRRLINCHSMLLNAHLDPMHVFESLIPASFQLCGDQPVLWVGGIILSPGTIAA